MSLVRSLGNSMGIAFQGMAQSILKAFSPVTYMMKGLEALLSPFEAFGDLAESIGSILSIALVPIVQEIVGFITPMLPILVGIAQFLAPILLFLFEVLTPLGKIISLFNLIMQFVPPDVATFITDLPNQIGSALSNLGGIIANFFTVTLPNYIYQFIQNIGAAIGGWWNDLGTKVTGGGADKSGWW